MLKIQAIVAGFALLAGGAHASAVENEADAGECDVEAAEYVVGEPYSVELGEEAREAAGAARLRAIPPGMMVTLEFDPKRLQIELDEQNRVVRVSCG
jgi:hypothetical protein